VNPGKQLHDLQQMDLNLGEKGEKLSRVESDLRGSQPLAEAEARLEAKQKELAELETKQRQAEWSTDDLVAKLKPLQQKLYAGSVQNPKELASLQHQVEQLRGQVRHQEDKTLEIMGQVEALQEGVALQKAEVKRLEKEWQKKRQELLAEQSELTSLLDAARKEREELAAALEPAHLQLYEAVRARKQGAVVAKIEQGRCRGCRITLSNSTMARARASELVQCDSCGRVLYTG
jgi:predicted  nucleic acid-binding Zn-ribbon protein